MIHSTSMTMKQNNNRRIKDIWIKLESYVEEPPNSGNYTKEENWVQCYGPLNSKILGRSVFDNIVDYITLNG